MTEDELAELRAYKPAEVARMLNMPLTRLETWVRENRVPHQRAGVLRGVEFSADDIRWIARNRPELMGGRRGGQTTRSPAGSPMEPPASADAMQQPGGEQWPQPIAAQPPVVDIAAWAQLRAHRPRPRST